MQPKWAPGAFLRLRLGGWELRGSCLRPVALQAPTHQNGLWSGPLPLREASAGEGGEPWEARGEGQHWPGGPGKDGAHLSAHHGQGEGLFGPSQPVFPLAPPATFLTHQPFWPSWLEVEPVRCFQARLQAWEEEKGCRENKPAPGVLLQGMTGLSQLN